MKQEKGKRKEEIEKELNNFIVLDEVWPWSDTWRWWWGNYGVGGRTGGRMGEEVLEY